ncbi:retrovirus-related Pol polyprotein from transposon TNT 1-94 [Trichonephila clavipes]|nr:retrovirus-related Pol polyprotein from transposon TNT 1-94 [Trichonephila clavipes]
MVVYSASTPQGFQLIRWLPQEFQSTVQQIYRWKEEDFRVVKIEAELILEANRLQLMKQDLEKAENAYLSSFTSKKSKTLPGATAAAHGDQMARMITKRKVMASKHCLSLVKFPISFGGEALLCFTYAWNRICHKDSNKTPFEKYSGRKPSVLHLKPFGCLAYAGVSKQIKKKFDMHAKMGIMMGYAQRTKGYRIWLIDENKLVETINVRFDENKRGINFRQKVNSNLGYNLNLPDYYDDEDDSDRVKDSLTSRLVSKTSTETPSTSEKPGVSSDNHNLIPCTEVKWIRNIDSDFATNRDDRVSMGGFITFIDETPISWRTFKQKSVSLSTMEAEYVSLTETAKEFIWLKNVIDNKSLNLELSENVMFCDNQAAISFQSHR